MTNVKEETESIPEICPNIEFEEAPADFLFRLALFFCFAVWIVFCDGESTD